ncbi:MAG: hydrogenase formation protein HypD [Desulfovibrio sp.]|nr:hydrogenase formation protein HypD [Desulfovibrio sp.]
MQDDVASKALSLLKAYAGPPLKIMEVCGTHTHEIFRLGIRQVLPASLTLISGPGCPVCVTPVSYIDEAIYLALEKDVVLTTFGDLLRVPGSEMSLAQARQKGAQVRMVYSPLDALDIARQEEREVVFLSVGFETTVPGECLAVQEAEKRGIANFSLLCANKTMPRAYEALEGSADAFLYPGHVVAISGTQTCKALKDKGVSGVVCGFTAAEILTALACIVHESEKGEPFFVNGYPRVVKDEGNPSAQQLIADTMESCDAEWRGLGVIEGSGLRLAKKFSARDARLRFAIPPQSGKPNPHCRCGEVLKGECLPTDCGVFGRACTPTHPVGACMVSSEGTCAAYFQYGQS